MRRGGLQYLLVGHSDDSQLFGVAQDHHMTVDMIHEAHGLPPVQDRVLGGVLGLEVRRFVDLVD